MRLTLPLRLVILLNDTYRNGGLLLEVLTCSSITGVKFETRRIGLLVRIFLYGSQITTSGVPHSIVSIFVSLTSVVLGINRYHSLSFLARIGPLSVNHKESVTHYFVETWLLINFSHLHSIFFSVGYMCVYILSLLFPFFLLLFFFYFILPFSYLFPKFPSI